MFPLWRPFFNADRESGIRFQADDKCSEGVALRRPPLRVRRPRLIADDSASRAMSLRLAPALTIGARCLGWRKNSFGGLDPHFRAVRGMLRNHARRTGRDLDELTTPRRDTSPSVGRGSEASPFGRGRAAAAGRARAYGWRTSRSGRRVRCPVRLIARDSCCRQGAATPLQRGERDELQRNRTATALRRISASCLPRPRARSVFFETPLPDSRLVSRSAKLLEVARRLTPTVDQRGPNCFAPSSEAMEPRFARSRSGCPSLVIGLKHQGR